MSVISSTTGSTGTGPVINEVVDDDDDKCNDHKSNKNPISISVTGSDTNNKKTDSSQPLMSSEIMFYLDHILEDIFNLLETQDLLNCRLVSHRWLVFAKKPLQKETTFHFINCNLKSRDSGMLLNELTSLLRRSPLYNSCFPCNKLIFTKTRMIHVLENSSSSSGTSLSSSSPAENINESQRDAIFQTQLSDFLTTYGMHIDELGLCSFYDSTKLPEENVLVEEIRNILVNQTPNLRCFYLDITPVTAPRHHHGDFNHNEDNNQVVGVGTTNTQPNSADVNTGDKVMTFSSDSSQPQQNQNLKVLELGEIPQSKYTNLIEKIVHLCPNLEEITPLRCSYYYLLSPSTSSDPSTSTAHLRFLTKLNLDPNLFEIENWEKIALAAREQQLQRLKEISLLFEYTANRCKRDPQYETRVVKIINEILKHTLTSVKSVVWENVTFLRGLELPKVMPAVEKFTVSSPSDLRLLGLLFPMRLNLLKIFPKLTTICLQNNCNYEGFDGFLNRLNFESSQCQSGQCGRGQEASKVTKIYVGNRNGQEIPSDQLNILYELFPKARIMRCVPSNVYNTWIF